MMSTSWKQLLVILWIVCCSHSKKLPAGYENYLEDFNGENFISPDINMTVLREMYENGKQNYNNPFYQWLSSLFGYTTTTETPPLKPPTNCAECSCGKPNLNRIVGGTETGVNQYPWMAMLMYSKRFYCGATLINDRYVLTASHCVHGFNPSRITVRLLEHDRSTLNETEIIERKVERIMKHPRYSQTNYNNDIALIKFTEPVKFEGILNPVCLPTPGKSFTGYDGVVTGWGTLSEGGEVASTLQQVAVPIMSNLECKKTGYAVTRITDNMLCAGFKEGKKDSCQGDSGGPLHVVDNTTMIHQIVGVVSWGDGCAKPNYPGVYARVNRYGTWIRDNTADSCGCS